MPRPAAATAAPRRAPAPARPRPKTTRRPPARRTSGPATGRTATATSRAVTAPALPRTRTRRPARPAPLVGRIARGRIGVTLDWILRGRACVVLFGALLAGVVFFNVSLLEKNEGIARMNQQSSAIAMKNQTLRSQLARYTPEYIQNQAAKRGFMLPAAGDQRFIKRGAVNSNARKAAKRIVAPGTGTGMASKPSGTGSATQCATVNCELPTANPAAPSTATGP
jgi:hypothetical protein